MMRLRRSLKKKKSEFFSSSREKRARNSLVELRNKRAPPPEEQRSYLPVFLPRGFGSARRWNDLLLPGRGGRGAAPEAHLPGGRATIRSGSTGSRSRSDIQTYCVHTVAAGGRGGGESPKVMKAEREEQLFIIIICNRAAPRAPVHANWSRKTSETAGDS